ncbi:uncharacterized protein [Nicotiana tomentosiformis]|uniref:uncharacterized protein n=1 Tax=Nicotiana tomentosiformis TaxID=4098 RepID=UPI00388CC472
MSTQLVIPVQPVVSAATSEEEQLRLARFKNYHPPTFSGLASKDAPGFLGERYRILHTMCIVETIRVDFTMVQLKGAAYQWWRADVLVRVCSPDPLGSVVREVEQLRWGTMSVLEYVVRFNDLSRHAPVLVSTIRERVCRFIEGLSKEI